MTDTVLTDIVEFVTELARQDIKLWLDGDQLRVNARAGALSPALIAQLKTRKLEIMNFLHAYASSPTIMSSKPATRPAQLPLSFAQQRLWFLTQFEGTQEEANESYNIHVALRLCGPLDMTALRASCWQLEERHEALRTTFPMLDGQAYQQINSPSFALAEIDLTHLSPAQQTAEVERLARQAAAYPFDLVHGPLWRVLLLRLDAQEHVLLVTMHHIISDGWSMAVLTRDLSVLYAQECGQMPETQLTRTLPTLPMHYADYALWQREQLQGAVLAEQVSYWQQQLAAPGGHPPPLLTLPTDHPRPAVQQHHGAELTVTLSPALTAKLKSMAQSENATLFMILQAAFAVLLARYAGQEDILVGTPVANRQITESENLIGFFVNTLVLRNDVTGNPTFRTFLARVRQMTLAAFEHQTLPFELVVEALHPERSLAHSPLFQVMFVLQNNRQPTLSFADVTLTPLTVEHATAKFDLTLMIWEHAGGLVAAWRYNTDLFAPATIERMAGHYQNILVAIVRNPDQPVAHLPLLSEPERVQMLVEWNNLVASTSSATDYPTTPRPESMVPELVEGTSIHQLFEAQAARTPDAIAVVAGECQLSYRALNVRANRLAHYLIAQGVGADKLVGLFVERSLELVVGVLGILKAGGAYVPLDPTLPAERLQMMLADMQSTLVVTQRHLLANLPADLPNDLPGDSKQFVCLDQASECLAQASEENPNRNVQPGDLAYILYTSGSTGKPKGVAVEHRQVVAYGHGVIEHCKLEPGMRYAMLQPLTVDSSVTMLFPSLWTGGVLQVIDRELALNANALAATFQRSGIDCLKIAPSHLAALLSAATDPQAILPQKRLIIGGEASQWPWVQELLNQATCQVYNHYGPTETTVGVLTYPVQPDPTGQRFQTTPLGYPLPNTQAYILDPLLQPLPIGALGELYIGGALVTRGYLNRPDLTAERFIPNPFGEGRLYRTGDWARHRPDGAIEFFGRMDGQVKIRGFRIELGEIEAQLRTHPQVREAIVVAREQKNGQKQLVAYVVEKAGMGDGRWETTRVADDRQSLISHLPSPALRDYLHQKLPDYMQPAAIVILDALPLSAHGKLDRLALPAPEFGIEETQRILPRTPTEATLAAIWQQVLGLAQVGVTDNFFQVGGDSIISIQIVSRARAAGLQLTPKDLFQHQTIAGLASVVRVVQQTQAEQGIVTGALPLTPIQHRFFAQQWREPHHFNQAFLLELAPTVNQAWLQAAVRALLTQHDALRLRFEQQGDGWQPMIVEPTPDGPFTVFNLSAVTEHEWPVVLAEQANAVQASLNLAQGPLVRVALFQTSTTNHLLFVIHHLAVDGVSWRILLEDLQTVYQQLAQGDAIQLPAKSTSFKAWATLLQEKGPHAVADERVYWMQLVTAQHSALPIDFHLGPNNQGSSAHITTRLDRAQTAALLNQAPAIYHTQINDLLLTALLLAFQSWTGQTELLIELEGHGREDLFSTDDALDVDLSRTVGWFTTIFPVCLEGTSADIGTLIKQVKEQLRQIPRRGIGYGILRYLDGDKTLATNAEVRFNYLGQFAPIAAGSLIQALTTEATGLTRSPHGLRTTLLDINASVVEGELQVNWSYSRNYHRAETIQQVADGCIAALHAVITHCQTPDVGGYTPSDFPDISLQQAGLDQLLAAIAAANQVGTVHKDPVEMIYPLSPAQQGMLWETLAFPNSGVHIEQSVFHWHGPLNLTTFMQAWQQVLARHTMLRTGFAWQDQAELLQFVLRQTEISIAWQSLADLCATAQQARIDEYLASDRQRGFHLTQAPLMRFALFQTAAGREEPVHQLVWTRHHILTDGWSSTLILKEMLAFYQAECTGQPIQLPPPPPYRNYIRWLRQQDLGRSEAFWRASLQGFSAPTALATKAGPGEGQVAAPHEAKHHAYAATRLPAAATAALYQLGQQHGLTTNSLIQAGWALLLHHHSGATDVLFGATVAGRPPEVAGVEAMVGLFINTLPVRIQLAPLAELTAHESLLTWLQTIQQQNLEQQAHAYCSAGQIQQWSEVSASLPLYESLLVFENYPIGSAGEANHAAANEARFEIRTAHSIGAQTNYALTLLVSPGAEIAFRCVYDTARFAADDIDQMLAQLLALVEQMIATPQQPLQTLLRQTEPRPTVYARQTKATQPRVAFVPPRTDVEQQLVQIWQAVLGSQSVGVCDNFFDLGGHSLIAVHLMAQIQQHFAVNLPLATLLQAPTIEQLASQLAGLHAGHKVEWPTLVPIQVQGALPPFFCIPGSGGNVLYLYELARFIGPQQPFYGLQAVGLDGETPPFTTIETIAAHNIKTIQQVQPQGPYVLGGHSFGGKVAFEMAQQLLRAGHSVAHLLLLDTAAPNGVAKPDAAHGDDAWWLIGLASAFSAMVGKSTDLTYAELQHLDTEAQLFAFKQTLERLHCLPNNADLKQARGLVEVFKRNALTNYAPSRVLPVPITLFRAEEAEANNPATEQPAGSLHQDPALGWEQFMPGMVEVICVPGNHLSMMARPQVEVLAQQLRAKLSGTSRLQS